MERAGPADLSECQTKCPGHFCWPFTLFSPVNIKNYLDIRCPARLKYTKRPDFSVPADFHLVPLYSSSAGPNVRHGFLSFRNLWYRKTRKAKINELESEFDNDCIRNQPVIYLLESELESISMELVRWLHVTGSNSTNVSCIQFAFILFRQSLLIRFENRIVIHSIELSLAALKIAIFNHSSGWGLWTLLFHYFRSRAALFSCFVAEFKTSTYRYKQFRRRHLQSHFFLRQLTHILYRLICFWKIKGLM